MCVCKLYSHWIVVRPLLDSSPPLYRTHSFRVRRRRPCCLLRCDAWELHCRLEQREYCDGRLSVSLFTRISQKPHVPTSPNFPCALPVAVAPSSYGSVLIRYVLPVLWMTSSVSTMGSMTAWRYASPLQRGIGCILSYRMVGTKTRRLVGARGVSCCVWLQFVGATWSCGLWTPGADTSPYWTRCRHRRARQWRLLTLLLRLFTAVLSALFWNHSVKLDDHP